MARFRVVLRFKNQEDDSFEAIDAEHLQSALCRAWPFARTSGIVVEDFDKLDDEPDTCPRCGALPHLGVCG